MRTNDVFEWSGRRIHTTVVGGGSGAALVLCHGTPFSSRVWEPVIRHLDGDLAIHCWDMPGYGQSSKTSGHAVDLDTQAAALCALVSDHWGLEAPSVAAHDIGGAVAARAHLVHGLEMARLVLVDAVVVQPWGSPFWTLAQQHGEVFKMLPANMHRALLNTYLEGAARRDLTTEELDDIVKPWLGPDGQAAFYRQIEQVRRGHTDDLTGRLDSFRCPVDVIWGTEDAWLPVDNGRSLAATLHVDLIEVADAGHLVQYDQPKPLAAHLNTLLSSPSPR